MSAVMGLRLAIVGALALVCGLALQAIHSKEAIIAQGQVVRLELAPVDPRSLMQGDYMALRFAIDNALPAPHARGREPPRFAVVALDEQARASLAGLAQQGVVEPGQVAMRIRRRDGGFSVGPNAFFFQEGTAADFEAARWGEFRVAPDGTALLTHLLDGELHRLGAVRR
ncbi:GDYXXLXY domain-containing protein [Thauera sp.]|uniref:GDYXXLXY domain-containing protein n=1 Tax=Thauera sp. TaxID=1905334 RepID=UPI002B6741B7|nr:GDYXXLXY domain-containing protein [Thauera sp.]HRP24881.1 GDYXXLXY domain-containing protein [Thauera sp.]